MHSGKRLSEIVASAPLPTERVLEIGGALAEAVGAAHDAGRPLGAVGPATVFVADHGTVRLLDAAEAPISARRADDLLALGMILYRMATGTGPYSAMNPADPSTAAPARPLSPIELNPSLPSGLVQLISRAVHPDPEERFVSAAEICDALREVRRAPGSLDSLLPAHHVSSSAAVKPPPRPAPGEDDDDQGELFDGDDEPLEGNDALLGADDESVEADHGPRGLPFGGGPPRDPERGC